MISETTFAQNHTSTWRMLAPTMDLLVRRVNLELYEREFPILKSEVPSPRRGFINEIAFNIFSFSPDIGRQAVWTEEILVKAIRNARQKIAALEGIPIEDIGQPTEVELTDCAEQVKRLRTFFSSAAKGTKRLEIRPPFPGAGIIDTCEGDIYFDGTLYEVKAGQRPYKSVDLKQLLTYAALNYAAARRPLISIGLFNPRMGTSFVGTLEMIAIEISGCSAAELLHEIIRVISSGDISR